jgi:hypothetical protein
MKLGSISLAAQSLYNTQNPMMVSRCPSRLKLTRRLIVILAQMIHRSRAS